MIKVPSLYWVEEVYPKDLGSVLQALIEAVEELQELVTTHLAQGRLPEGPRLSPREEAAQAGASSEGND